jgi:hypothetical protein
MYRPVRLFSSLPWFVDSRPTSVPQLLRPHPPAVPNDAPAVLKDLRDDLSRIPHLDPASILISRPVTPPSVLPLPLKSAQGRRKRGATYSGESAYDDDSNGLWSWVILAQVKEGTENRGSVESVVRAVRKSVSTNASTSADMC